MRKVHDRHPALTDHVDQPVAASENALGQYHGAIPSRTRLLAVCVASRSRVTVELQSAAGTPTQCRERRLGRRPAWTSVHA